MAVLAPKHDERRPRGSISADTRREASPEQSLDNVPRQYPGLMAKRNLEEGDKKQNEKNK